MNGGVGARLREVRRQRGIDLAEVAAATNIQLRFLKAIEGEEWERLPGEFYARSFVRTYAAHLDLEPARVLEELRRVPGSGPPPDRVPRIDPEPPRLADSTRRGHSWPRPLAAISALGLAAVLVAVGLSSLNGSSAPPPVGPHRGAGGGQRGAVGPSPKSVGRAGGTTLSLAATAEVWVCLLDRGGRPLIDGKILAAGAEAGPYRSGGFVLGLGNGAVTMTVGGRPASVPPSASPIGFSIDRRGKLRQLSEGERPTCT
jgi:transcriptional regulator with XRE-family HTH domain